ncbi:hypothetical protein EIP86_001467 [Pleurotus ostreatoroseus]|nr:hypothetical protein EIP86_001467 [Pleurotus ostreatoroseus]
MRQQPYPESRIDTDVFEDLTEEYVFSASHSSQSSSHTLYGSQDLLKKLVLEGKLADAYRVREELKSMGIHIRRSFVYQKAALQVLAMQGIDDTERTTSFLGWWPLIPHLRHLRHTSGLSSQTKIIRKLLYEDVVPNIPLIIRSCLHFASAGFERRISRSAIPIIVRQSHPELTLDFLAKYKKADYQCRLARCEKTTDNRAEWVEWHSWAHRARFAQVYGLAIREQCAVGRAAAAVTLLEAALRLDLPVSTFTAEFVLSHLRKDRNFDAIDLVSSRLEDINTLQQQERHPLKARPALKIRRRKREYRLRSADTKPHIADGLLHLRHAADLKALLSTCRTPGPEVFKDFINTHGIQRDTETLHALQRILRDSRLSETVISSWLNAELSTLVDQRQYDAAILLFATNFWSIGVPNSIRVIIEGLQRPLAKRSKLWPTSHHLRHVWRMAISQAHLFRELNALHVELCRLAKVRVVDGQAMPLGQGSLSEVCTAPVQFDDLLFSDFVDAYTHRGAIMLAMDIPTDLARLHIPLSEVTFRALVKSFMRIRTYGRTLNMLRKLDERASHASPRAVASFHNTLVSGREVLCDIPHPLIPVYLAAIVRFQVAGCDDHAGALIERLKLQTSELDFDVDHALKRLHDVGF